MTQKEIKKFTDKIIKECKSMFKTIDEINKELHDSKDELLEEQLLEYARKATGAGDYIEKRYLIVSAIKINEELAQYEKIKLDTSIKNEKFISTVAEKNASLYVKDLRLTRNILESYVNSANRILSVIRMHLREKENKTINAHI